MSITHESSCTYQMAEKVQYNYEITNSCCYRPYTKRSPYLLPSRLIGYLCWQARLSRPNFQKYETNYTNCDCFYIKMWYNELGKLWYIYRTFSYMLGLFSIFVTGHESQSDINEKQLLYKKKNIQNLIPVIV
jgi:hypothetical protein